MRQSALTILIASTALLVLPETAGAELSVEAQAFSEVVYRGASLTDGKPAIGATLSWDWRSGWFAGAGGYYASGTPSGASLNRNVRGYFGWFTDLGDTRAFELSLAHNEFVDVSGWSYTEARVDYHFSRVAALTLGWSPDYYGRDAASVIAAGVWQPSLSDRAYLILSAGAGYLSGSRDSTILWGEAGVGYATGRFNIAVSFNAVDQDSAEIFLTPRETVSLRVSYLIH